MTQPATPAPGTRGGADPKGLLYAGAATLVLCATSVLIRYAAPLSPFEIAFGRLATATAAVWLLARFGGERPRLTRRDLPVFALFGLVLATNSAIYPAALSLTTIPHGLMLGAYSSPIFITILSRVLLHEPLARRQYLGIAVTIVGAVVLVGFEPKMDGRMLVGDLLALGAGLSYSFYSIIGRAQRTHYPLFTYAIGVYGSAALWSLPAAAITWTGGLSVSTALVVCLLGAVALGGGQTLYAAALRRVHATVVNTIGTQEVTGGMLLGMWLLGEDPSGTALIGGLISLAGVALVVF